MRSYSTCSPRVRFVLGALGARRGQAGLCTRVRAAALGREGASALGSAHAAPRKWGERARALPPASSVRPLPRLFLPGGPLPSSARSLRPAPSAPLPPPSLGFGGSGVNGTGPAAELGAAGGTRTTDRVVVPAAAAET